VKVGIAAVGDVCDIACWSGIPYHFWQSVQSAGFVSQPWRIDLDRLRWPRRYWNGLQCLTGQRGGFQYSNRCLDLLEKQIAGDQWQSEIISFNQHFPRASTVALRGGILNHYLDAPFVALASGRGLDLKLPRKISNCAAALERENYSASNRIVAMGRWAADVIVSECDVPARKVNVILPGANLVLPEGWKFPQPVGQAGIDRPFTLGFVGKDWQRKGLPLLVKIQSNLAKRGWKSRVLAAGAAPPELKRNEGVEFVGFIDKSLKADRFLQFLTACDVGCLFSDREALGISTLEFLRAGTPVAGFAHEGPADTLPPDAGFRFPLGASAIEIADCFESYLRNEADQERFRENARRWSSLVTWTRCVREFQELWETGGIAKPVQPWKGLAVIEST